MPQNAETRKPSDEQKAAHVRKTRVANYQASMRLEGFEVHTAPSSSTKSKLIQKYKKLAMKCA